MSDFMRQFLAGWQMGQDRIANQRADQAMQMRQDQEAYQRQQDLVETKMREEQLKIQKQRIDAEAKAARLEAAQKEHELRSQAQYLQGMPAPTAQDVGIQQTTPQDVGPTLDQINVPQPTMPMPSPTGGEDIQMPVLTGRQQQELALAEQQRKMREALGMLQAQEEIKAQYRQPDRPVSVAPGGTLIDPASGRVVFKAPDRPTASGSMTGEGGKPLLSGEITKFNDFRSGLNTIARLSDEVGKTGAAAKAGTMIPGFVTELTGWGAEAKSRQAVLDQAKQVVGKAMEGGVLRKEDEAKYMKILPIINDPPDVAKAKLDNLRDVMAQDAEIYLETLEAAGRNVGKVRETLQGQLAAQPKPSGGGKYKIIEVR